MEFTSSQTQTVIEFIQKKNRDKRFIKNWSPISSLNIDYKVVSKALVKHQKNVPPSLITNQQITYVQNRRISEQEH